LTADVYIPTFGLVPNSSYIPEKYLNTSGFVKVDEYFQVKGLEKQHVWAIGDISDLEFPQVLPADRQSTHLAKNIALILNNKAPVPYKEGTRGKFVPLRMAQSSFSVLISYSHGTPNRQKRWYWTFWKFQTAGLYSFSSEEELVH
jgi:NADH dehydrogenase FAD-containing subunit